MAKSCSRFTSSPATIFPFSSSKHLHQYLHTSYNPHHQYISSIPISSSPPHHELTTGQSAPKTRLEKSCSNPFPDTLPHPRSSSAPLHTLEQGCSKIPPSYSYYPLPSHLDFKPRLPPRALHGHIALHARSIRFRVQSAEDTRQASRAQISRPEGRGRGVGEGEGTASAAL